MKKLLVVLLTLFFLLVSLALPAFAAPLAGGEIDFRRTSYGSMPNFAGAETLLLNDSRALGHMGYNPSRSWSAGTRVADIVMVGDLYTFGVGRWTVAGIAKAQGRDLYKSPLGSFSALNGESIASITRAMPALGNQPVRSVPLFDALLGTGNSVFGGNDPRLAIAVSNPQKAALADFLSRHPSLSGIPLNILIQGNWDGALSDRSRMALVELRSKFPSLGNVGIGSILEGKWNGISGVGLTPNLTVSELIERFPDVANMPFGTAVDLNKVSFTSLPGIEYAPLGALPKMGNQPLTAVPGLKEVPLKDILGWAELLKMNLARVDIPFGSEKEKVARYTLSGSTKEDILTAVPCVGICPNIELDNTKILPNLDIKGRQWVTKDQLVPGGKGLLGKLNKGLEPTGLTPWGPKPNIKLVITKIDEQKSQADLALYLRFCVKNLFADLGCTPYFLGPIPFGSVKEKGTVVIATTAPPPPVTPPGPPPGIDPPPQDCKGDECKPKPCPPGKKCVLLNPNRQGWIPNYKGMYGAPRPGRIHQGVDLQSPKGARNWFRGPGETILAAADGRVIEHTPVGGKCGGVVGIQHPEFGIDTRYLHMVRTYVSHGQVVKRGQAIGVEGNEIPDVCSFGAHLHYEIWGPGGSRDPTKVPHEPPLPTRPIS